MRIAIISDIHGNITALDAMLKHAQYLGVSKYFVLGDLVGYYQQPEKVINKIKQLDAIVIQGNHERMLKKVILGELSINELTKKYGEGHQIAMERINEDDLYWLINLPIERDINIGKLTIKLCHGAPNKPDAYIYPDADSTTLLGICNSKYDFIFMGHTHYPFIFDNMNCTLINVGSIGLSKDIGGVASWGFLDTSNRTFVHYRTPYNIDNIIDDIMKSNNRRKEYLISALKRNRFDINT